MGDLHDNVSRGRLVWVHCLTAVHTRQYRLAAATAAPADFLAVNEAAPAVPGTLVMLLLLLLLVLLPKEQ